MARWEIELEPARYVLDKYRDADLIVADPSAQWPKEDAARAFESLKPTGWLLYVGRVRDLCAFRAQLPQSSRARSVEFVLPLIRYDLYPISRLPRRAHLIAELFPHPEGEGYYEPLSQAAQTLLAGNPDEDPNTMILRNEPLDLEGFRYEVRYGGAVPERALAWLIEVFTPPGGQVLEPEIGPLPFAPATLTAGRYYVGASVDEDRVEERRLWLQDRDTS